MLLVKAIQNPAAEKAQVQAVRVILLMVCKLLG
jgi:hypothetical protein